MNARYLFAPESMCSSGIGAQFTSISAVGENRVVGGTRNRSSARVTAVPPSSLLIRMAMRVSRARWYSFLRRVFHYQNGSRSDLGSNPFNSGAWMVVELVTLVLQIMAITCTLAISNEERPVWPMRIWVSCYGLGCIFSLPMLFWRYRAFHSNQADGFSPNDNEESRNLQLMNKCRTMLELFFAIWFVMGNVWVFESRFGSFRRATKLHMLCICLLAWNAVSYSFPFILFILLCCCVPITSTLLGYNMSMGSIDRGASDEQLLSLPSWRYKLDADNNDLEAGKSVHDNANTECCICLAKYREKEEVRQLPCSHMFHLKCVDQWLRIVSCCPLCKQELDK